MTSPFSTIAKLHARLEYVRWGRRLPDLLQTLSGDVRERAAGAVVEAFVSRSQLFEIGRDGLVLPGGSCKVLEDPVKTFSKDLYGKKRTLLNPAPDPLYSIGDPGPPSPLSGLVLMTGLILSSTKYLNYNTTHPKVPPTLVR